MGLLTAPEAPRGWTLLAECICGLVVAATTSNLLHVNLDGNIQIDKAVKRSIPEAINFRTPVSARLRIDASSHRLALKTKFVELSESYRFRFSRVTFEA